MKKTGFTLMESLLYLALLGLFSVSISAVAHAIAQTAHQSHAAVVLERETEFVFGKLEWILSSAVSIVEPVRGSSSRALVVRRVTGLDQDLQPLIVTVRVSATENALMLAHGEDADEVAYALTGSEAYVSDVEFQSSAAADYLPEATRLLATCRIWIRSADGSVVERQISRQFLLPF